MKRLIEVNEYEHKGIKIMVCIDHIVGKVTLVEKSDQSTEEQTNIKAKEWKFKTRGLEYMQGWQNILDAIKYAIAEATKLLREDDAEEKKLKEKIGFEIIKFGISDHPPKSPKRNKR